MSARITICGDLCPTPDTRPAFEQGDEQRLFNSCVEQFKASDLVMGNLEFPMIDNGKKIAKTGPVLSGKTSYAQVFKNAGFHLLGMANNHIKDLGEAGVLTSIQTCQKHGINHVGAGTNIDDAKEPYIQEIGDITVGILAFAEQEFNTAGSSEAGANYIDVYYDFDLIRKVREHVDYLIILYHGGIEYHPYPSPLLQKRCRKMAESGAELIVCQHSHCIGSVEEYSDSTILYGQGNTLFGKRNNNTSWNQGLLIELNLDKDGDDVVSKITYKPIEAVDGGVDLISGSMADEVLEGLKTASSQIGDPEFIQKEWELFCERKKSLYMALALGFNRILIHLNRLTGNRIARLFYPLRRLRIIHNLIRCESHYEVMRTVLRKMERKR